MKKDYCPGGDNSSSYYDDDCGVDSNEYVDDSEVEEQWQDSEVDKKYIQDLVQVNSAIFNSDFSDHQCYPLLDEKIIYQDNDVNANFMVAHQMLYSYQQTMWRGTKDYAPERKLTREEAARFMVEFAKRVLCRKPNYEYTNQFVDIEGANPTLIPYIKQSYEYKIFHGDSGGASKSEPTTFRPKDEITYDELMAVMVRLVTNEYADEIWEDWSENYKQFIKSHVKATTIQNNYRKNIAEAIYDLYKLNHYILQDVGFVIEN